MRQRHQPSPALAAARESAELAARALPRPNNHAPAHWPTKCHKLLPPPQACAVPPLLDTCSAALVAGLSPGCVVEVLEVADCLAPVTDPLRAAAVEFMAANFGGVLSEDPEGVWGLGAGCLGDVLRSDALVLGEKAVFDAVMAWAGYGVQVAHADSVCRPMADVEAVLPLIRFPLMSDEELQVGGWAGVGEWKWDGRAGWGLE